jgi:hypothetical protein
MRHFPLASENCHYIFNHGSWSEELHRAADPIEGNSLFTALADGLSDDVVIALMMGS